MSIKDLFLAMESCLGICLSAQDVFDVIESFCLISLPSCLGAPATISGKGFGELAMIS